MQSILPEFLLGGFAKKVQKADVSHVFLFFFRKTAWGYLIL